MAGAERIRVSYLELCDTPVAIEFEERPERIELEPLSRDAYLDLYRRVGAPLKWDTRLLMAGDELDSLLAGDSLRLYVLRAPDRGPASEAGAADTGSGAALGFCELDRSAFPQLELKHFGLIPEAQGRGLGPWLLSTALHREWAAGARRIWLHTDAWDHPAALRVYLRAGFRVYDVREEPVEGL